ncbi:glutaminase [Lysobacter sp. GX 14042]|uniref:glutaminase n=1 Tax=Lysobacter sp. GX 14042 TaxID=2907155 RepID=UPI001F273837|nr:glutaminase [Lysobacter sp. GX 14042]MCE7032953.1 glutaminase [Lysobacter sp. GX 14042]
MAPISDTANVLARHDLPGILAAINAEVRERFGEGRVADYIPMLGSVPVDRFGMALVALDGQVHCVGDAREPFSVQSVSKVHSLTLALEVAGAELWDRVGREPSGVPFNSLVQLEFEGGVPRNPLINSGALVVADVILSHYQRPREALLEFMRARSGNASVGVDREVFASEKQTGYRNTALVNFIRSFGNIHNDIDAVLDFYYAQCSLEMDCLDLARSVLFLADEGHCPVSGVGVTRPDRAKRINAVMLTCGTYDAAGDFAFHVGLPAKSGVGGGIVAVVPKVMSLCVWSPGLDTKGNSLLGGYALHRFTEMTGLSIF